MAMLALAREVQPRGITAVILNPAWVRTDMGGPTPGCRRRRASPGCGR